MFHALGFLFIVIIALIIIGLTFIAKIIRSIINFILKPFGLGTDNEKRTTSSSNNSSRSSSSRGSSRSSQSRNSASHKKIFDDDEGDYVDFEEC